MANRHFGKIGDVWKHLALAEILASENLCAYWESHAGSALYSLTHSIARDYGVFHFFAKATTSAELGSSAYYRILQQVERDGQLRMYPGSPLIAMQLLVAAEVNFLFCDLDTDSLGSLRNAARELHLAPEHVRICQKDGIVTLNDALADLSPEQAGRTFAHLDPYLPFAAADHGLDSAELQPPDSGGCESPFLVWIRIAR